MKGRNKFKLLLQGGYCYVAVVIGEVWGISNYLYNNLFLPCLILGEKIEVYKEDCSAGKSLDWLIKKNVKTN